MNINATDIAAYLGAAAWIPQIIGWFYNLCVKPVITVIPDKSVSIGYTRYGPLFNLRLSLNADKKDALIDFIGVDICHQDGSKHSFEWTGMTEFFSEVRNNKGENQIIQRDIVPISIKLSTLSPVERFFRFQDSAFIKSNQININELTETQQFMQKSDSGYHDAFLKTKEFEKYLKFMRESFYWKAGIYTVNFRVRSPASTKLTDTIFKFELTQDNIDMLRNNLEEIKVDIEYFIKKADLQDFNGRQANWMWVSSILKK